MRPPRFYLIEDGDRLCNRMAYGRSVSMIGMCMLGIES